MKRKRMCWVLGLLLMAWATLAGCQSEEGTTGGVAQGNYPWQSEEGQSNVMMEVRLRAPGDWMKIRSGGANFFASEERRILIFSDVVGDTEDISVDFEDWDALIDFCEAEFADRVLVSTRGELRSGFEITRESERDVTLDGFSGCVVEGQLIDQKVGAVYPYVAYYVDVKTDSVHRPTYWFTFSKAESDFSEARAVAEWMGSEIVINE